MPPWPEKQSKHNQLIVLLYKAALQRSPLHPITAILHFLQVYRQICGSHPQKDQGGVIALSPVTPVAQCHCAGALQLAQEGKTHLSSLAGCPLSPVLRSY